MMIVAEQWAGLATAAIQLFRFPIESSLKARFGRSNNNTTSIGEFRHHKGASAVQ